MCLGAKSSLRQARKRGLGAPWEKLRYPRRSRRVSSGFWLTSKSVDCVLVTLVLLTMWVIAAAGINRSCMRQVRRGLASELGVAGFAEYGDFDFTWVGE